MGSRGWLSFDLNEPPAEDIEESDSFVSLQQPQKALPSANLINDSEVIAVAAAAAAGSTQGIVNNKAFSHASSVSGFQPFSRRQSAQGSDGNVDVKEASYTIRNDASYNEDVKAVSSLVSEAADVPCVGREEGEWSDADGSADVHGSGSLLEQGKASGEQENNRAVASDSAPDGRQRNVKSSEDLKAESSNCRNSDNNVKGPISMDYHEEPGLVAKQEKVKGIEVARGLKGATIPVKRKTDHLNEAKLGKKRSRQTMFLNLEDVKQAGPIKTSTPRRQAIPAPITTRTMKESRAVSPPVVLLPTDHVGENQSQPIVKEQNVVCSEGGVVGDSSESARLKKQNGYTDSSAEVVPPIPRQISYKQPMDTRLPKNSQVAKRKPVAQSSMDSKLGNKKPSVAKKQMTVSNMYQDTSVERLIREVTNEKFWHNPGETELQCVPDRFESVEDYVRVFEPLLFEECRAQLYSTWEELTEGSTNNAHTMVRVRSVERRERGWYDVVVLPANESNKWTFKEGDVAVLSTPRPGLARSRRNSSTTDDNEEPEISGRVAGTVRRHIPIDTRDPVGAILHFYIGDTYESNSMNDNDHILRKLQPKGTWFLTVLGSLATTQREYIALHAFRRLNVQMQTAILHPSPEHFPKYEQQSPAMPECFTPNFVDHLHRSFNGPQLSAIQWAAVHTASGTSGGKRQDPWPFTLVQGPPGTGKTHTVWGMLNVIHLVQYQQYYTSLLKKLAPESYKQNTENNTDNVATGSIDEVLQSMDQNLFRILPKLCPKPRMLVCAPSNAATDELLSRVLDRGFIDGEMKVYRPDVARVGVDTQTRAAQAVSVERRTEQLLVKNRDEVFGYMHQLRGREAQLSMQIATLQRELTVAAAAVRSQGSVGVDPDVLLARDQSRDALLQNLAAAVESRDKTLVELSRLFILEGKFRASSNFNLEEARASLEASFANEAEIVFTTVSSSGRKLFSRLSHGFDMVVIDEAAQASEVGVLPPLALGAARCVLVGDPQQLPATVISKAAGTLLYSRSLFERFQQATCPTMLLSVQYRMHPQIRDFPSRYFYQGRLTDSESVANLPDELYYKDSLLKPYVFYDITHGRESHRGGSVSYQNVHEAQFCVRLYEHLQKTAKSLGMGKISVGIITPYKLQLKCLQREFDEALKSEEGKDLYINTVDAFQGQERDVIIMSCVRASGHGVGFVADIRRMNVALTRARRALWVMGNANALMQSDDWAALIIDAKARNCYMDMETLPKEFLGAKGPSYNPVPGKLSSNMRGLRSAGPRHRSNLRMEFRSGTPSEDDDKYNAPMNPRNGYQRPMRPQFENSLDDFDQSGDKSRDAWQYGIQRKHSPAGVLGKREI